MTMQAELFQTLKRQWLTPLEALRMCNCLSLSQRCGEFRRQGHAVMDRWVKLANGKRVKQYRIV